MTAHQRAHVVVIGGGQAGLAAGFYLRRAGADFVILDAQDKPGGAWRHAWPSLRLFSPAQYSSLPGWMMPPTPHGGYPTAADAVGYLTDYEQRYDLPVIRPVTVRAVRREDDGLLVETDTGTWHGRYVISTTGTWWRPYIPHYPGRGDIGGQQLHTADYSGPEPFQGQNVIIVGGGNSAAQILAELSTVANTTWVTRRPPRLLPDAIDGKALFDLATRRQHALAVGETGTSISDLGDIVAVPSVRDARDRGALKAEPMFARITRTGVAWRDGTEQSCDAILWCTGFRPALLHLSPLRLRRHNGLVATEGTRALTEPRLHLLGYGDWTGPASATLIGASRTARATVAEIMGHPTRSTTRTTDGPRAG
ncbi:ArsO family NAD(P)H-dependent flavin-containing monooxygenase [Planotetraspora kaengkrachanensis]|uniref:Monooxygenase n=1 Tax=Planotetraspora kaengkrachanensis TaxID=575193 RepID=A0A8J3Q001_9ACTN|nr:ArsO family NAD(P)H-dependent flavin-containing monooxygenase [Planotetraspora kaengkrachanensis]GIG84227.1 monooxygenase [Planotetraspora kaengkrachanensis]